MSKKVFLNDTYGSYTFEELGRLSSHLSRHLLASCNKSSLHGQNVAVYCSNNYTYLISILAIWMARGTPFCLSKFYPLNYLDYFLDDARCQLIINGRENETMPSSRIFDESAYQELVSKRGVRNIDLFENRFHKLKQSDNQTTNEYETYASLASLFEVKPNSKEKDTALLLYTSGTSGPAKGVLISRAQLLSSIETMIDSWRWTNNDKMLHTLPLNHFSGLVYCLLTQFYIGAQVEMLPRFDAETVWSRLVDVTNNINTFIGVPTIFVNLVDWYMKQPLSSKRPNHAELKEVLHSKMRIIGTGSAPLNVKTYEDWFAITNYKILERYGMTEIGMVLSNPYKESASTKRIAGTVGRPCKRALVRIVDEHEPEKVLVESNETDDRILANDTEHHQLFGELQVKGPMVFTEYNNKPQQTNEAFTSDGWFKTGDTAEFLREQRIYKIVGRTSVDVIKSGGYKISALDIERELLAHPSIDDVAIMGLNDPVWGQKIFALLVLKPTETPFDQAEFIDWCKKRLPKHSVPRLVKIIDKMPRNLLGKVNKKELIVLYNKQFGS